MSPANSANNEAYHGLGYAKLLSQHGLRYVASGIQATYLKHLFIGELGPTGLLAFIRNLGPAKHLIRMTMVFRSSHIFQVLKTRIHAVAVLMVNLMTFRRRPQECAGDQDVYFPGAGARPVSKMYMSIAISICAMCQAFADRVLTARAFLKASNATEVGDFIGGFPALKRKPLFIEWIHACSLSHMGPVETTKE